MTVEELPGVDRLSDERNIPDNGKDDSPKAEACAPTRDEEIAHFITAHVLEQDAQFFDG